VFGEEGVENHVGEDVFVLGWGGRGFGLGDLGGLGGGFGLGGVHGGGGRHADWFWGCLGWSGGFDVELSFGEFGEMGRFRCEFGEFREIC